MAATSTGTHAFRSDRHRAIAWLGFLILLLSLLAPQLSIESAEAAQTLTTQQGCDEGFVLNERTGQCEPEPQRVPGQIAAECPEGTTREAQTGACIPVTETPVPETETPVVTEEATEVPATETPTEVATEPPAPQGYAQAIKRACPDDFIPDETTTITELQNTCVDPIEGVPFHILVGEIPHATVPTDATGLSQLGSAPAGEIVLVEEIPAGYGEPVVYCAEDYAFAPFEHAYTEEDRQPVLNGNAIAWTLPADTLIQCFFYNIAATGLDGPGEITTQNEIEAGEGADVTVIKHRCPLGVPENLTVEEYIELCTAMFEGIDFTLDHTGGSFPGTTGENGVAHWNNVPAGEIDIQEEIPEGYKNPIALCVTFEGEQELESSEAVATGGLIELDIPENATAAVCWVVNIPDPELATSVTVNKWRCPIGFDPEVNDAEAECTEPMDGVTFKLGDLEATTGETIPGVAQFVDIPAGIHWLEEVVPEGMVDAFSGACAVNGEPHPPALGSSDPPATQVYVEPGSHVTCEWYNVPDVQSRVVVEKHICPEGVDFALTDENTIDHIINACSTEVDGFAFSLDHAGGSSTEETTGGGIIWEGIPNGPITITEHIPPGYEEPVWICNEMPFDEFGDFEWDPFGWEQMAAPGGVLSDSLDETYGQVFTCRVFNTTGDDGDLILHKWICPPGYDVHAEGADPKVDCTETPGAITFQFGQPGLGEEAMLQDTGDIIEDGVFFSSLEPGEWKMVEFAPEWVESAFIGSCTVNGAPVPADPPLNEGLEWEVEIDSGEVIECDWYNVPSDDNSLIVHKKLCPAGFDPEVDDAEADCTEPMGGVTFTLGDMEATTGDDQGVAIFEDVPAGEHDVTEVMPDGIAFAFVSQCTMQFGPIVVPLGDAQPPVMTLEFDAGSHWECFWYNVPEVPEENEIEIYKWQCPEGTGFEESLDWYEDNCVAVHNGVWFSVDDGNGVLSKPTIGGVVQFVNLPSGIIGIQETIPDGFGPPVVFCAPDDSLWAQFDAPTGYWEYDFPNDGLSETLVCYVFNIPGEPPSITVTKWTCPPGYDLEAVGADPKTDCTEATDGVTFELRYTGQEAIEESQTTGDVIPGGVLFDDLEPDSYEITELVPPGIGSVFVVECTGHIMGVLQPYPLSSDNVLEDIDLDAGEHLVCDWYNVPEIEGGKVTVIKHICSTETFVSAVDCEIYEGGATFDLLWWDGAAWQVVDTETTDGFGLIVWTDLDAGDYWLDEHDGAWCHITSTPAGDEDSFPVPEGEETVVDVYNCDSEWVPDDTPEKYPNTGVPPAA